MNTAENSPIVVNAFGRFLSEFLGGALQVEGPTEIMLVPQGYQAVATEKIIASYLDKPRRVVAMAKFWTLDSFTRYVGQFKQAQKIKAAVNIEPYLGNAQ